MGDTVPLAEDTDMASGFLTATQGEDLTLSQRKHLKNEIKISFTHLEISGKFEDVCSKLLLVSTISKIEYGYCTLITA